MLISYSGTQSSLGKFAAISVLHDAKAIVQMTVQCERHLQSIENIGYPSRKVPKD